MGYGVPQDYAEAEMWYRKAAEQGHAEAKFNLGIMYYNGRGVLQDYVEAAKWYHEAAEQGDQWAQNNLGVMHENGEGVPTDWMTAYMWFDLAARQGNEKARENRTELAARMTATEVARAEELVWEWFERDGQAE
jgi:TPR repeat protein